MENLLHKKICGREVFTFYDLFLNKNQIVIWKDDFHLFAWWFDGFVMKEYKRKLPLLTPYDTLVVSTFNSIIHNSFKPWIEHKPVSYNYNVSRF